MESGACQAFTSSDCPASGTVTPLYIWGNRSSEELRSLPKVNSAQIQQTWALNPGLLMQGQMGCQSLPPDPAWGPSPQPRGGAILGAGPPAPGTLPRPALPKLPVCPSETHLSSQATAFPGGLLRREGPPRVWGHMASPWPLIDSCALLCHSFSQVVGGEVKTEDKGSGRLRPTIIP